MTSNNWPFQIFLQTGAVDGNTHIEILGSNLNTLLLTKSINFAVHIFTDLASCGGFSEKPISPSDKYTQDNCNIELSAITATKLNLTIRKININIGFYSVLFNLIESISEPIEAIKINSVIVVTDNTGKQSDVSLRDYPQFYSKPRFILLDDRTSRSLEVVIEFCEILKNNSITRVTEILENWMLVGLLGGFRVYGAKTFESTIPLFEVFFVEDKAATFSLYGLTASSFCIDSLLSCLSWISSNVVAINRVQIE